jgi:hypothetical protein
MLWRWACRRHPKKNKKWIKKKYFKSLNGKNWVFSYQGKTSKHLSTKYSWISSSQSSDKKENSHLIFICLPTHSDLTIVSLS